VNILDIAVKLDENRQWRFYPIGDPHADMKVTNVRRLKKYIKFIAQDPNAVALCVGDIFNGSLPGHKYFSSKSLKGDIAQNTDDYANEMMGRMVELFSPILEAGIPFVIVRGNHDRWVKGINLIRMLVDQLNLKYGSGAYYAGDEALIRIRAGNVTWSMHAEHGAGGGYTESGKIARFMNGTGKIADVDINVRGHVHDQYNRIVKRYYVPESGKVKMLWRKVAFLTTTAFNSERVENVVDYPGQQGLPPIDEGVIYLRCTNPRSYGPTDPRNHPKEMHRVEWEG
jgi:UDP-2,3-diacylglucosamine pyrophosphatase LpxH